MSDKRKPLTPKEIAMRSRKARKGGLKRKENLGKDTGIVIGKASTTRTIDSYRYN